MPRKPAIILFLLLLLLSIGGVVFHQNARADTEPVPSVPQINHYLANLPESTGWKLQSPFHSNGHYYYHHSNPGFLERHGWNRHTQRENHFAMGTNLATGNEILITIWTENDQVMKIQIISEPPEPAFKQMLFHRFPALRHRDLPP